MSKGIDCNLIKSIREENPILAGMLDNGIIDAETAVQQYYMAKFDALKAVHHNKISEIVISKTGQHQWRTYVGTGKTRKLVTASTQYELKKKLLGYYGLSLENSITMEDCWETYIANHPSVVNSPNSTLRAKQLYEQHLKGEPILKRSIDKIKKPELELFCNELIKRKGLTRSAWGNIKAILNGIFEVAVDQELISTNTFKRVSIKVKFAQQNKKSDDDRYFNAEELEDLRNWMLKEYRATQNIACIAILIQAVTGMRVGELGALSWNDILEDKLHIHRELVLDQSTQTHRIEEHTKGYSNRFIPIHPKIKEYLKMIKARPIVWSDLVLRQDDGGYVTTCDINNVLKKYAIHTNHKIKYSHCLRRTYATLLYLAGVDKETIQEYLGHADLKTTEGYICAKRYTSSSIEILSRAL